VKPLAGRRIALPAGRALDRLVALFREEGATPVPCRLTTITDVADPAPVDAFLRALAVGALDDLILLTGEGLRRLLGRAERTGRGKAVRAALGRVRKVTRGPKPALALHEVGLAPDLPAPLPTTEGVIQALALAPLRGRRVGVQLCGPNDALLSFLARSGALVQSVTPYLCAPSADNREVEALIADLTEGRIDAVAFTNAGQVEALYAAAAGLGLAAALDAGLASTLVAAIGPTTAAPLRARGLEPEVTPRPHLMKRLAATVAAALGSDPQARSLVEAGGRLRGRRIAIPEHRELDRLATMLEEEGASTVRCPLMAIFDAPDPAPVERWLRTLAADGFDDVIFFTGEGVRRLLEVAARLGLADEVVRALQRIRKITRGPKPARALHELGIRTDLPSAAPTTAGVIDSLREEPLAGRRVGVQLYGEEPNRTLVDFLESRGALVLPVAPYRYAPATHDEKVAALIDELAAGQLDGIAFTTAVQVERLFQVARRRGTEAALQRGLQRVHVAVVGPVVIEVMRRHGIRVDAVPARGFFMRRLAQEMAARLGPRTRS
jgi:uroporphyrinogen-III synthase